MPNVDPLVRNKTGAVGSAIFALGFRPFFLLAGLFSVLAISAWSMIYLTGLTFLPVHLPAIQWHAHAMVFGYAMAVVSGFMLTAVGNWTGIVTLRGWPLAGLALLWLAARLSLVMPGDLALVIAATADLLFGAGLLVAIAWPVWRTRQWKQLGILSKVFLLVVANATFYAGLFGALDQGVYLGLYGGLYVLLALVFAMGRRVIPFFIERGVNEAVELRNRGWIDWSSLVLFPVWIVLELFFRAPVWVSLISAVLFLIHALRLRDWHTPGIWSQPLLWSLYVGYGFVLLGFALKAAAPWHPLAGTLATHAFAYGVVGLVTLGMMARVALGHTGRNVFGPPAALTPMLALVVVGALIRVLMPLIWPAQYVIWIGLSQAFWIVAFAGFVWIYAPVCWHPRIDGRPG